MNAEYLDTLVSPCLTKYDNTPHFLMELSKQEYTTLEHCCIHISDIHFYKSKTAFTEVNQTEFNSIKIGKGIQQSRLSNIIHLNIDRSKRKMLLIIMDKDECWKCPQDAITLNTMLSMQKHKRPNIKHQGSGKVILMMAIKARKNSIKMQHKRVQWSRLIQEMCNYCKDNILESNMVKHHSSKGRIHSFGYQGVFKKVKNSSVGLYAIKQRFNDDRQHGVEAISKTIEEMISVEMSFALEQIAKIVVNVDRLLLPVMDVADRKQHDFGDIGMKKDHDLSASMWNTNVCVNASTGDFHTEKDTSYSLITVPSQKQKAQKKCGNKYSFLFKLNANTTLSLPMSIDLTFLFSGTFLSHRQEGNNSRNKEDSPFINLSSYGNQRLFTHIRKSFSRTMEEV